MKFTPRQELKNLNFMKCSQEQEMYTRNNGDKTLIVGMHVNDLINTSINVEDV